MNKIYIIFVILCTFLFTGCPKKEHYVTNYIEKVPGISYISTDEIMSSYIRFYENIDLSLRSYSQEPKYVKKALDSDNNSSYKIGFYYKDKDKEYPIGAQIDLCEHGKSVGIQNKELLSIYNIDKKDIHELYYSYEVLKKSGIISNNPEEQKDICLYQRAYDSGYITEVTHYTTNKIIYTAKEVNEFLDANGLR